MIFNFSTFFLQSIDKRLMWNYFEMHTSCCNYRAYNYLITMQLWLKCYSIMLQAINILSSKKKRNICWNLYVCVTKQTRRFCWRCLLQAVVFPLWLSKWKLTSQSILCAKSFDTYERKGVGGSKASAVETTKYHVEGNACQSNAYPGAIKINFPIETCKQQLQRLLERQRQRQ